MNIGAYQNIDQFARAVENRDLYRESLETQRRLTFLAEASKVLMSSLTAEDAFHSLARLMVPVLADYCIIYSTDDETDKLIRVAHAHDDTDADRKLGKLLAERIPLTIESPIGEVARSGCSCLYPDFNQSSPGIFDQEPNYEKLVSKLRPNSAILLPVEARGNKLGVVVLGMQGSERRYSAKDLTFTEEIVSRAALVIDNTRSYARAQEANRLKEEFLATLSHELRTPLTAILGYARLLLERRLDESASVQAVQSIHRNAELQNQLISDLLDISRIVTGKLSLEMRATDLNSIVERALDAVRLAAEAKSHSLKYTADPIVGHIAADPDRIQQVVWNLVSNAIKFTPPGGDIRIRLQSQGSWALIKVSDNGAGVNPEFLPYVFEKFSQADNSTTRQNGGLGLGLAIVRHLAEMHGGTVCAESEGVGRGATFTVKLPLKSIALKRAG